MTGCNYCEDAEMLTCYVCMGSGNGIIEGTKCAICHGSGKIECPACAARKMYMIKQGETKNDKT